MNETLRNKYVLGALTLRDLKDRLEGMEVKIDELFYAFSSVVENNLELWETLERMYDNEAPDRKIDLETPVKLKDGSLVIQDIMTGLEETLKVGRTEFVQEKIEIDLKDP